VIFAGLAFRPASRDLRRRRLRVLVLYILKLRRRVVAVPFSPLWERHPAGQGSDVASFQAQATGVAPAASSHSSRCSCWPSRSARRRELIKGRTVVVSSMRSARCSHRRTPEPPRRRQGEVKKMIRGLGGQTACASRRWTRWSRPRADAGDTSALERELDASRQPMRERTSRARSASRPTSFRGIDGGEVVVVSDGALGLASDASGPVHLGTAKLSYVRVGREAKNVGVNAVCGAPLSARQESLRGHARAHEYGHGRRGGRASIARRRRSRRSDQASAAFGSPRASAVDAVRRILRAVSRRCEPHLPSEARCIAWSTAESSTRPVDASGSSGRTRRAVVAPRV